MGDFEPQIKTSSSVSCPLKPPNQADPNSISRSRRPTAGTVSPRRGNRSQRATDSSAGPFAVRAGVCPGSRQPDPSPSAPAMCFPTSLGPIENLGSPALSMMALPPGARTSVLRLQAGNARRKNWASWGAERHSRAEVSRGNPWQRAGSGWDDDIGGRLRSECLAGEVTFIVPVGPARVSPPIRRRERLT